MKNKTKDRYLEDKVQFLNHYNSTERENLISNASSWFDSVQETHRNIRKKIKGVNFSKVVKIESGILPLITNGHGHIHSIIKLLPDYLKEYDLKIDDFSLPYLEKFKGISTIKHIKTYSERYFKNKIKENLGFKPGHEYNQSCVRMYLSYLAAQYGENKFKEDNYGFMLGTSCRSFLNLGHYQCDEGSCFGDNKDNWFNKYNLAARKDTFVIIMTKGVITSENTEKEILGRCWGFLKDNTVCISNKYCRSLSTAKFTFLIKKFLNEVFSSDYMNVTGSIQPETGVYQNGDEEILIEKNSKKKNDYFFTLDRLEWEKNSLNYNEL